MSSTFGSFNTVRLGIYAAQKGLDVTGNNITNINTTGYTRQRLDQSSFVGGGADHYSPTFGVKVGNGVLTTGVSQLRDPFLDIAYPDRPVRPLRRPGRHLAGALRRRALRRCQAEREAGL